MRSLNFGRNFAVIVINTAFVAFVIFMLCLGFFIPQGDPC